MKKILALTMTGLMLVSLAACTRNNYGINQGQGQGITRQLSINQNAPQVATGEYRDGTFTGISDRTSTGYESATVDIRNGRIANIVLRRIDAAGREIGYDNLTNNMGTGNAGISNTNNAATGTNLSGNNYTTNYNNNTGNYGVGNNMLGNRLSTSTVGTREKGLEDYGAGYARRFGNATQTPGGAAGSVTWGDDDNLTHYGRATAYGNGTPKNIGTTPNAYGEPGTVGQRTNYNQNTNGNMGTGAGNTNASFMELKARLIGDMIQANTYNVNTDNLGNSDLVNNWKTAVMRALEQARK